MSVFDPYKLYYHQTKSTRKGQVIQKKPTNNLTATTHDQIPSAVNVLTNFGYHIYPPFWQPRVSLSSPFTLTYRNISRQALEYTVNTIWPDLLINVPNLADMYDEYPTPRNSSISIGITTAVFRFPNPFSSDVKFYNQGNTITINDHSGTTNTNDYTSMVTYFDQSTSSYYRSVDYAYQVFGQYSVSGDTDTKNRNASIDLGGVLNYITLNNAWQQINSQEGLEDDFTILNFTAASDSTRLVHFSVSGFIAVVLNDQ